MSKYQAYNYLRISRASFDNYVREGKIPQGKKELGWKEKMWYKADLDNFVKEYKDGQASKPRKKDRKRN